MKTFITETFLLETDFARELYHHDAAPQPIYDYHCHLSPQEIADNRSFRNLYDIWLAGDHYKWRAMRANGVPERFCTGDAPDEEKFEAFARTIPYTLRNPLYHWSHLELLRYFEIDLLLEPATAREIWDRANQKLREPGFTTRGLLEKNRVALVGTTDDPTDTLEFHRRIAADQATFKTRVYPAFRPDKALTVDQPSVFKGWLEKLGAAVDAEIATLPDLLEALEARHTFFHEQGCRLSDHGLESCPDADCTEAEAARIFDQARNGIAASPVEKNLFSSHLMLHFGALDHARGWTKQLHLGALRNTNPRILRSVGTDAGCDSIGDFPQARAAAGYLGRLEARGQLPRMILYNLNPADNYLLATMAGNFQDSSIPGKIQFGSGWWFLDQAEGMTWQMNALSNLGLLRRFVGMITDSRSFLSYPRHEYFRRLLCNLIGNDVARGLLPRDPALLGSLVREVCFKNAQSYFGMPLAPEYT